MSPNKINTKNKPLVYNNSHNLNNHHNNNSNNHHNNNSNNNASNNGNNNRFPYSQIQII